MHRKPFLFRSLSSSVIASEWSFVSFLLRLQKNCTNSRTISTVTPECWTSRSPLGSGNVIAAQVCTASGWKTAFQTYSGPLEKVRTPFSTSRTSCSRAGVRASSPLLVAPPDKTTNKRGSGSSCSIDRSFQHLGIRITKLSVQSMNGW